MKKYLIGLVCCMVLGITGCNSDYTPQDKTNKYQLSDNLSDCSITELRGSNENDIIVVRCPLSSTTTAYSERCCRSWPPRLDRRHWRGSQRREPRAQHLQWSSWWGWPRSRTQLESPARRLSGKLQSADRRGTWKRLAGSRVLRAPEWAASGLRTRPKRSGILLPPLEWLRPCFQLLE